MPSASSQRQASRELRLLRTYLGPALFGGAFVGFAAANIFGLLASRAPTTAAAVLLAVTLLGQGLHVGLRRLRRFLWRISRRLIISYSLIAIGPIFLLIVPLGVVAYLATGQFIAASGWRHIAELKNEVDSATDEVAAALVAAADGAVNLDTVRQQTEEVDLARLIAPLGAQFPGLTANAVIKSTETGLAYVPVGFEWPAGVKAARPRWWGTLAEARRFSVGADDLLEIKSAVLRAAPPFEVYVEVTLPLDNDTLTRVQRFVATELRILRPADGRLLARAGSAPASGGWLRDLPIFGVRLVDDLQRWTDGAPVTEGRLVVTRRTVGGLYEDLRDASAAEYRLVIAAVLILLLVALVGLEVVTLAIGVGLARSITGPVHELSVGTQRIESGQLSHRIRVWSDDQLGELSHSFNRMAVSVENLVRESAERERLEGELRIGREIQQSLLPAPEWVSPRFEIAAISVPAKEVGGDYYDLFELGPDRLGILVADVSGKGTQAAFYMAELKGIMLAVTNRTATPAEVLSEANTLLGRSLDRRTFVSMAYAELDLAAGRLTFGRAGHSPVLHLRRGSDQVEAHQPAGLALGIERRGGFAARLESRALQLGSGDVVVFFTDGVTEAMAPGGGFYEQARLERALLAARGDDVSAAVIRDRLMADLREFAPGPPHDDLTLIVLRAL